MTAPNNTAGGAHWSGLPWLAAALAVVSFAGTFPVTRALLSYVSPWYIGSGRVLIAGVVAAAVLLVVRAPLPPRPIWPHIGIAGLGVAVGFPLLSAHALTDIAAASAGAQSAVLPLLTAVTAVVFAGEKPPRRFWWATLCGSGAMIAFALRDSGFEWRVGNSYMFAALIAAAFGYVAGARATAVLPAWQVTCWFTVLAVPVNLVLLLFWVPDLSTHLALLKSNSWLVLGILQLAIFSQFIGFIAWNFALAKGGIARMGQVQLLQPFVTLALAAVWLKESISLLMMVTVVVVLLSLVAARKALNQQHSLASALPKTAPQ